MGFMQEKMAALVKELLRNSKRSDRELAKKIKSMNEHMQF